MLYVFADLSVEVALVRALLAVPGHCAGGMIIAVGVCEREFYGAQTNFCRIILPSWLFHGFYDWFLMASAVGYEDSDETGELMSLLGLCLAVLCDLCQFYYLWYRLRALEETAYASLAAKPPKAYTAPT